MSGHTCNRCSIPLSAPTNWYPSAVIQRNYTCRKCFKKHNSVVNKTRIYLDGIYIQKNNPLYDILRPGNHSSRNLIGVQTPEETASSKEGYVYVITSKAHKGWVKIGMADDPNRRLSQYQTSSPYRDFTLEHSVHSTDNRKAEAEAHLRARLVASQNNYEWFKLSVEEAITILDNLNEHRHVRATKKADTHKKEDNLQGSLF
jgi:predicted GIY-YIG superfamily endonuclease